MCNLYTMTATVDELRRLFGGFEGDTVIFRLSTKFTLAGRRRCFDATKAGRCGLT